MTKEEKKAYDAAYSDANSEKIKARRRRAYQMADPKKRTARNAAYYVANAEKIKARQMANWRMNEYGLSPEAFQLMLRRQKNACVICEDTFSAEPHVDHCHKSGKVRGLLCGRCNRALGGFRDSPKILERAREYLRRGA